MGRGVPRVGCRGPFAYLIIIYKIIIYKKMADMNAPIDL